METLLTTIRRITEENTARGKWPAWPLLRNLRDARPDLTTEQIQAEAAELEEAGLVHIGRAISDSYYELIEQPAEEDLLSCSHAED